jgi:hypothetical protein
MSGNNLSNISTSLSLGKFKHLVEVEMEDCDINELNTSLLGKFLIQSRLLHFW